LIPWKRRLYEEDSFPPGASDMGLTEREHAYWGVPKEGDKRVKGYPPYVINPAQNFRTSNVLGYNYRTDVLGRNWIQANFEVGSVEDDLNFYNPAYWDGDHPAFDFLWGVGEQDGRYGHKPRVISVIDDNNGIIAAGEDPEHAGLYFTAQDSATEGEGGGVANSMFEAGGWIGHWDGLTTLIPASTYNTNDWMLRTVTTNAMDNGTEFGYGFTGDFSAGVDLTPFDPTAVPMFPKSLFSDKHDIAADSPGFGRIWIGFPRVLFRYSERWYALAHGYIYDRGEDPLDDGSGDVPTYCAAALWACNVGEEATNIPAWAHVVAVFAPFDVGGPFNSIHDAASKEFSYFGLWPEEFGGKVYFTANPCNLPTESSLTDGDITNDVCVWCLDGGGLHASLHWYDTRCTGGPLAQYGSHLYFPMISVPEQTLFIYRLDDAPDHWSIIASIAVGIDDEVEGSRPFISTAWGHNGRISVVYGKRPSILNDAYDGTDPPSTAWSMKTWNITTGVWRTLSRSIFPPGFSDDDHGIFARLFPLKLTDLTGGGGVGTGPCDDTFSAFGTPTISEAVFGSVMSANSSPLLGEHTASYFYAMCTGAGLNPSFALAQWVKESVIGAAPGAAAGFYNVGNIRCHSWGTTIGCAYTNPANGYFATYANWTDGVQDYNDLISGPAYAGYSISAIISKYAPSSENDTALYISQTCDRMAQWKIDSGL
jgi:hypothetical protein